MGTSCEVLYKCIALEEQRLLILIFLFHHIEHVEVKQ